VFRESDFARFSFMFFAGATFCVLKEHVVLSRSLFWLILIVLFFSLWQERVFSAVYTLSIAYLVLFFAYVPSGYIRKYNMLGDYSYGMYIYAYPVQQSVAALMPGVSVVSMILLAAGPTIVLAVMSWHLLERRALALKGALRGRRAGRED
jgi:peptidoglycan/LPS O-acetylase OafA/YrhL